MCSELHGITEYQSGWNSWRNTWRKWEMKLWNWEARARRKSSWGCTDWRRLGEETSWTGGKLSKYTGTRAGYKKNRYIATTLAQWCCLDAELIRWNRTEEDTRKQRWCGHCAMRGKRRHCTISWSDVVGWGMWEPDMGWGSRMRWGRCCCLTTSVRWRLKNW